MWLRFLLLYLALAGGASAQPGAPMTAERLAPGEAIRLDGHLNHPAWQRAPVFDAFVEKHPQYGAAPPQATRVQLLFDDAALYVGLTVLDTAPQQIRAPLVRHDQVLRTQDFVVVYVDAIGSKRAAQFFRVNAAGSLGDGMHTAADDSEDFAPDFDWDAATQRTADGWTAVLRLPFASLRYAQAGDAPWRIMVARRLPREQFHLITSTPVPREAPSFIHTLQRLDGVRLPAQHRFLTLRPSVTLRHDDGGTQADASLALKWRPRAELVIDGTLNPDFSQVALDVPQLSANQRFALFVAEKRPFFFESSDLLRSPTEALYTRSLTAPRAGLRATWRGEGLAGTLFGIDDRGGGLVLLPGAYGTGVAEQPASRVLAGRVAADRGDLQGGLMLASRRYDDGSGDNLVFGPDLGWQLDPHWRVRAQWLHARTSALADGSGGLRHGPTVAGDRAYARVFYNRDRIEANVALDQTSTGFRHDTGFVTRSGVRKLAAWAARGWEGVPGLNEFWVNTEAWQVEDRQTGQVIESVVRPGVWVTGAHNLEAWLEWFGQSRQRLGPGGPMLAERYGQAGVLLTPAPWWSLAEASVKVGRRVDAREGMVRDGREFYLYARLRPLPALELEPRWSLARLEGEGRPPLRETAAQGLAVWHLGSRQHLRAIVQRNSLQRGAAPSTHGRTVSLTWSLRRSAGTVLYVGASRSQEEGPAVREAFVKLQVDVDEALALF